MKTLRLVLITIAAVWLEVSFLGAWRPFGVMPNLFLVVVLLAAALLPRSSDALAMAVGGGFLLDLVSGADFGLRTGFFTFLALLVTIIRRTGADFSRVSMRLAAVVSATVLYDLTVVASLVLSRTPLAWGRIAALIGVETLVNGALMLLLYWPLRQLLEVKTRGLPVIAKGR